MSDVWALVVHPHSGEVHVDVQPWAGPYRQHLALCCRVVPDGLEAVDSEIVSCADCLEQLVAHVGWCQQQLGSDR